MVIFVFPNRVFSLFFLKGKRQQEEQSKKQGKPTEPQRQNKGNHKRNNWKPRETLRTSVIFSSFIDYFLCWLPFFHLVYPSFVFDRFPFKKKRNKGYKNEKSGDRTGKKGNQQGQHMKSRANPRKSSIFSNVLDVLWCCSLFFFLCCFSGPFFSTTFFLLGGGGVCGDGLLFLLLVHLLFSVTGSFFLLIVFSLLFCIFSCFHQPRSVFGFACFILFICFY